MLCCCKRSRRAYWHPQVPVCLLRVRRNLRPEPAPAVHRDTGYGESLHSLSDNPTRALLRWSPPAFVLRSGRTVPTTRES